MRRTVQLAVIALAVVTASVSASDIKTIGSIAGTAYLSNGTDGWNVAGLSDDGKLVAASSDVNARYYDLTVDNWGPSLLGTAWSHGVATWAGDGTYNTVNAVAVKASGANPVTWNWNRNGGATIQKGGVLKDSAGNKAIPAAFNAVSLDYATGNGWMVGHVNSTNGTGVAYKITAGNVGSANGAWQAHLGSSYLNGGLNGVSNNGVAAGVSSSQGAILADVATPGSSVIDIVAYAGADMDTGNAIGVSANATLGGSPMGYVGGYFKTNGWRHAFLSDLALGTDAAAAELFPVDGAYAGNDEAVVHDVSNNGIAIGMDIVGGVKTAVVWLPGSTQAVTLASIMNETLPADNSISNLVAAVSITAVPNVDGAYTIAGQAAMTAGGTRGFVATILPEPATLTFLALGGLALLRRRH